MIFFLTFSIFGTETQLFVFNNPSIFGTRTLFFPFWALNFFFFLTNDNFWQFFCNNLGLGTYFSKPIFALKPWDWAGVFEYHEPYNRNDFFSLLRETTQFLDSPDSMDRNLVSIFLWEKLQLRTSSHLAENLKHSPWDERVQGLPSAQCLYLSFY